MTQRNPSCTHTLVSTMASEYEAMAAEEVWMCFTLPSPPRLQTNLPHPLAIPTQLTDITEEEQKYVDAALAAITEEQRKKISKWDILTIIRGYQTYEPRLEETNKAMKVGKKKKKPVYLTSEYRSRAIYKYI